MKLTVVSLISAALLLTGCPSPNTAPRQEHEAKRDWNKPSTPENSQVTVQEFSDFDLDAAYVRLKDPKAEVLNAILVPLVRIVLNANFIENIDYHGTRLDQMINVFNRAFVRMLQAHDQSPVFLKIKEDHFNTLFAGCRPDLSNDDCINARLFSNDGFHSIVLANLAMEYDAPIEALIAKIGSIKTCVETSEACRAVVEKRYRLLAMGARKTNRNDDAVFTFAYLKYSRGFAYLVDYDRLHPRTGDDADVPTLTSGYVSQVHSKIFETMIAQFDPKKIDPSEFRKFVENFNPWIYSALQPDIFRYGTRVMFEFGAGCCLYDDKAKTIPTGGVTKAIKTTQAESDAFGTSFTSMLQEIREKTGTKEQPSNQLFINMGMEKELVQLLDSNSAFYNEYFLIVDRLFRGHWSSDDVAKVLKSTDPIRTRRELPKTMLTYIKVYLLYMVMETNGYMSDIFRSEIASSKVFEYATQRSRTLTTRWHNIQTSIDLVNASLGSFLNGQNIRPEDDAYSKMMVGVNRTVHYISVNTTMIVMTYFLSKMSGTLTVQAWYGPVTVDAGTILDTFFDGGVAKPWFVFGKDQEPLDRRMLLYSWEYLLSTRALDQFSTKEGDSPEEGRGKFFDRIFSGYLDGDINALIKLKSDFDRTSEGSSFNSLTQVVCDYELGKTKSIPTVPIDFMDLAKFTYSGAGGNSVNLLLRKRMAEPMSSFQTLRGRLDSRLTFLRAMVDIMEADLFRTEHIPVGTPHRTTKMFYDKLKEVEGLKRSISKLYNKNRTYAFECSMKLQEVERRRMNRLYQEERDHLGHVFDLIAPVMKLQDPVGRDKLIKQFSVLYFRDPKNGYRFDEYVGPSYRMSQYDLYKRIQRSLENDIFTRHHPIEDKYYGSASADAEYLRPRHVKVIEGDGIERDAIVANQTSKYIHMVDGSAADRARFINEGMAVFNGEVTSYVGWQKLRSGDVSLIDAVNTMMEFYLMGPVVDEDKSVYSIEPSEIVTAYIRTMASYGMDEMDLISSLELKVDGRFDLSFFRDRLFEANGNRLPFFFQLMNETRGRANLQQDLTKNQGEEALTFARTLNNLRPFVFEPSPQVRTSVKKLYGDRSNEIFKRAAAIYDEIARLERENPDPLKLDPRLERPMLIQNGAQISWYSPNGRNLLSDSQKRADFKFLLEDFIRRTNDFYETKAKVPFQ